MGFRRRLISTLLAAAVAAGAAFAPGRLPAQPAPDAPPPAEPASPGPISPDQPARDDQPVEDGSAAPEAALADPSDPAELAEQAAQQAVQQAAPATQPAPGAGAPATAPALQGPDVVGDLQRLRGILTSPDTPRQADRDEAAAQLVSRQSTAADGVLRDALSGGGREARLAVARAVADDPTPPGDFIDALGGMLAGEPQRFWADAAALALSNYRRNGVAVGHLTRTAVNSDQPAAARFAAIRALGRVVEVSSAETLLRILNGAGERRDFRDAAADALAEMTGLRENGRDPRRWSQWWQQSGAGNDPGGWRAAVLESRAARFDRLARRHEALVRDLQPRLWLQYQAAGPPERRAAVLLDVLSSTEPDVRAAGARVVTMALQEREQVSPAVRDRLVAMVGDYDTRVREDVVRTLTNINYAGALGALLTQLAQERDDRVKLALVNAVAPIEDPAASAAPQLLALVSDPSPAVALAAVKALGSVGRGLRDRDPALADRVAARLRTIAAPPRGGRTSPAPGEEMRVAALDALAPLRDKSMLPVGGRLLTDPSPAVRAATLRVLGELGSPDAGEMVSDVLRSERDPVMRQLALDALGKTGGLVYAETLYDYMQSRTEADPAVREKAWQVFRAALPRAADSQLANAAGMFKTDPDRHVHVARAMAERFQQRGVLNEWAMQQQNIADDLMKAKGTPQQPGPFPAEAADHYERALNYWVQNKNDALTIDELTRKVVDARLQAGQWQQATAFAQSAIKRDIAQAQEVGPRIKNHADELRKTDRQAALALIDAALRMNPPLDKRHQDDLRTLRSDVAADGSTVPGQQ